MSGIWGATIKRVGTMSAAQWMTYLEVAAKTQWRLRVGDGRDHWTWTDGEVMYVKLEPGQRTHAHTDHGIRTHYVLQTNPDVEFTVGGERVSLEEGGIYELDTSLEHACINRGETPRIHRIEL